MRAVNRSGARPDLMPADVEKMAEEVMRLHSRGEVRATALRSSDYYGPGVVGSALGDMVFGNLVAGKKAQISGSALMPHSFAYIEDVGRAAAGRAIHPRRTRERRDDVRVHRAVRG